MSRRTRNETRWSVPFHHYASLDAFLAADLQPGGNSFVHHGRDIDVLIEHRGATTTLVVFNGDIPLNVPYVPYFTGRGIAKDLGLNLIAVSDPVLIHRDMTVAWYLGDQTTGPLRPVLVPAIRHALQHLGGSTTILFGASGGGFSAAHYAQHFPNCTALVINPRLTLERRAQDKMATYLRLAHQMDTHGAITDRIRTLLTNYGPTDLATQAQQGLNHDLLIYQNFFDSTYLQHHLLPFLREAGTDPRCYIRFANDGHGHVPIPPETVRQIISLVSSDQLSGVRTAGFVPAAQAPDLTGEFLPEIAQRLAALEQHNRHLGRERDALEVQQLRQNDRIAELKARSDALNDKIQSLNQRVEQLRTEPVLWRRIWHIIPRGFRQRIRQLFRRTSM